MHHRTPRSQLRKWVAKKHLILLHLLPRRMSTGILEIEIPEIRRIEDPGDRDPIPLENRPEIREVLEGRPGEGGGETRNDPIEIDTQTEIREEEIGTEIARAIEKEIERGEMLLGAEGGIPEATTDEMKKEMIGLSPRRFKMRKNQSIVSLGYPLTIECSIQPTNISFIFPFSLPTQLRRFFSLLRKEFDLFLKQINFPVLPLGIGKQI